MNGAAQLELRRPLDHFAASYQHNFLKFCNPQNFFNFLYLTFIVPPIAFHFCALYFAVVDK